jgi:hypothetical protein
MAALRAGKTRDHLAYFLAAARDVFEGCRDCSTLAAAAAQRCRAAPLRTLIRKCVGTPHTPAGRCAPALRFGLNSEVIWGQPRPGSRLRRPAPRFGARASETPFPPGAAPPALVSEPVTRGHQSLRGVLRSCIPGYARRLAARSKWKGPRSPEGLFWLRADG